MSSCFSWHTSVATRWRRRSKKLYFEEQIMNDTVITDSSHDRRSVASESRNVDPRRGRRICCLYSWKVSSSLCLYIFCLLVEIYSVRRREDTIPVKADIDVGRTLIQTDLVVCFSFRLSKSDPLRRIHHEVLISIQTIRNMFSMVTNLKGIFYDNSERTSHLMMISSRKSISRASTDTYWIMISFYDVIAS